LGIVDQQQVDALAPQAVVAGSRREDFESRKVTAIGAWVPRQHTQVRNGRVGADEEVGQRLGLGATLPRMKRMISSAPSCANSSLKLPRTRAAAASSRARRSSLTLVPTGVMTILPPSRLKVTSLPGATPAA
jgi:hypothetical protein